MDCSKDPHQRQPILVTNSTQAKPVCPPPSSRFSPSGIQSSPPSSRLSYSSTTAGMAANVAALTREHMTRASRMISESVPVASLLAAAPQVVLPYSIHDYSSHSGSYRPQHICVNNPSEQGSRWSSGTHDQAQFITLALGKPAVVNSITFGKLHRAHVCNLKEFKVFGGLYPDSLTELLHSGLKNDTVPETFVLRTAHRDTVFPIQYLKIVPLATFGPNFNYSIWYVELRGVTDDHVLQKVITELQAYQELETNRLCLKHLRQRNMMDVFHILKNRTGVELEHPLLTELHKHLVLEGDFETAEQNIQKAAELNLFKSYAESIQYTPTWRRISATSKDGDAPGPRGGHQMCIDSQSGKIYLLGGWNGKEDLADFWCFDVCFAQWELITTNTSLQGGPSPRSCHKMCFDPVSRSIFVLGRYVNSLASTDVDTDPDFFRYFCDTNKWIKLSNNTARDGGPSLIFDHQMCIDTQDDVIYVFGGRITCWDTSLQSYSGLYAYSIKENDWKLIRADDVAGISGSSTPEPESTSSPLQTFALKSRVGHSMVFDPISRELIIFAGQRGKDYMLDLCRYAVDSGRARQVTPDYSKGNGPDAGFTQRATMDPSTQELYVLSGYMRGQAYDTVRNSFWVFDLQSCAWHKLYQNEARSREEGQDEEHVEPSPRIAHQMIYDETTKTQYIFGGNPGDTVDGTKRLDDFWELRLTKPNPSDILRRCLYMIRMQKLREMCRPNHEKHSYPHQRRQTLRHDAALNNQVQAIHYLRHQIAPLVDQDNDGEQREFLKLCGSFICESENGPHSFPSAKTEDAWFADRTHLYESLLAYFPDEMKEPEGQLLDAVKLG